MSEQFHAIDILQIVIYGQAISVPGEGYANIVLSQKKNTWFL